MPETLPSLQGEALELHGGHGGSLAAHASGIEMEAGLQARQMERRVIASS